MTGPSVARGSDESAALVACRTASGHPLTRGMHCSTHFSWLCQEGAPTVPPGRAPWPQPGTEGRTHLDNMSDEGVAYRQFHGWRLTCAWCEYVAEAKTKTEALTLMQAHYDRVCGVGNAVIGMGRVDG